MTDTGETKREAISLFRLERTFPDDASARAWFESIIWPEGRYCSRCGNMHTAKASKTFGLPYYCPACRRSFSVKVGTLLENTKLPLGKWAFAIYVEMTHPRASSPSSSPKTYA